MRLRTWLASLGMAALAACGGGGGDDVMGDDMPPGDGAGDTTAPALVSSTPAADAAKVSVIAPLSFVFDESLDPATVTDANVTVEWIATNVFVPVVGTVAYDDATKTVTFTPKLPLGYSGRYKVTLSSMLTDVAGNAFAAKELLFHTTVNATTRTVNYNNSGGITVWLGYTVDNYGHQSRFSYYDAPGQDGQWLTADDIPKSHNEYTFLPGGIQQETRYYDAGADLAYNTADDRIIDMTTYQADAKGLQYGAVSIDTAGADQMWGTADDVLTGYSTTLYEPKAIRSIYFNHPGTDGQWKTADDRAASYLLYKLDDRGFRKSQVSYNPGADLVPNTPDDLVQTWVDSKLDANGTSLEDSTYGNPGADGMWFTADDTRMQLVKYDLDANGYRVGYMVHSGAGPDQMWGTADDVVSARQSFMNDAHGLQTRSTSYSGPGGDGTWGTADDVVNDYKAWTYDQSGQRTDQKAYSGPGNDGVWFTADDKVASDTDFDVAH